jgi:hypothetical protein
MKRLCTLWGIISGDVELFWGGTELLCFGLIWKTGLLDCRLSLYLMAINTSVGCNCLLVAVVLCIAVILLSLVAVVLCITVTLLSLVAVVLCITVILLSLVAVILCIAVNLLSLVLLFCWAATDAS